MDGNDTATPAAMVDQLLTELGRKRRRVRVPGFGTLMLRGRIWWIRYSVTAGAARSRARVRMSGRRSAY
jgi:hypothetical protein